MPRKVVTQLRTKLQSEQRDETDLVFEVFPLDDEFLVVELGLCFPHTYVPLGIGGDEDRIRGEEHHRIDLSTIDKHGSTVRKVLDDESGLKFF